MPIEIGFWKIDNNSTTKRINYDAIETENKLETILTQDISLINENYLLLGRQIRTSYGKSIDLLAIDEYGKIVVIELKKDKTPREVVAQTLDYASWVQELSYKDIIEIYKDKNNNFFEKAYEEKFATVPPEKINQEHEIIIVCSELDNETARIIEYLSDNYNVPINVVFFRFFKDNGSEYISRSWLMDPKEVEEKTTKTKQNNKSEVWNGKDFVVNIDTDKTGKSTWEDSRKYNFISAGGGKWYIRSLNQLEPGHRIFAMIPGKGYVGVGIVKEKSKPIKDYYVNTGNDNTKPIVDIPLETEYIKENKDDLENCEYLVKVEWIKTIDESKAYWEKGLRANQNSAFKLKNDFTLQKLIDHFELDE